MASGPTGYGPPELVVVVTVVVTLVFVVGVADAVPVPERIESNRSHAPEGSAGTACTGGVTEANSTGMTGTATGTGTSVPPAKVIAMTSLVSGASG